MMMVMMMLERSVKSCVNERLRGGRCESEAGSRAADQGVKRERDEEERQTRKTGTRKGDSRVQKVGVLITRCRWV